MLVRNHRKKAHGARPWLGALAAAALLLLAFAVPMIAASTKTQLSGAGVSPRTGTTATTVHFAVVYQNASGARAERVAVVVGGVAHEMTREPGGSWGKGVTFTWSGTLGVGTHAVVFTALAKDKSSASLPAGNVAIAAIPKPTPVPTPTPRPTPRPTPAPLPTPRPTPRPTPAPTPKGPTAPGATPAPTPSGITVPTAEPTPAPPAGTPNATPTPPLIADVTGGTGTGSGGVAPPDLPTGPGGGTNGGNPVDHGPVASLMAIVGLQAPVFGGFGLGPTLVTTTGAVAAAMAFGLFGRRRREDDPTEDIGAAAARGIGVVPLDLVPQGAGAANGIAAASGAELGAVEMEALLPRWRRPSLLQARKADPVRDSIQAPRLTFDEGLVGPLDDHMRRVIRYRVVRLLDSPDELRGTEIGYLDQGDEVQLLEKYGAYWRVLSPDGQQGWLHKMVLGDVFGEEDEPAPEGPVATMPLAAESWTMAEADIDSDVLDAYLESRRRRRDA